MGKYRRKKRTTLPVLIKGILHPEDAKLALENGVDGIVVSNHGGRQLDGVIPSIDALPAIVEAVNGQIPVLFDSGIRQGADVVKALALRKCCPNRSSFCLRTNNRWRRRGQTCFLYYFKRNRSHSIYGRHN